MKFWMIMVSSEFGESEVDAVNVSVTDDTLSVDLSDGRTISVPINWYSRLAHATQAERNNWRLIAKGIGIHWEEIDEDISVEGLLAGRASGESQKSLGKWLENRFPDQETSIGIA